MTRAEDSRLAGRPPEFVRSSRRPGIGGFAADEIASELLKCGVGADVPSVLRHGKKLLPLDRYLRERVRARVGRPSGVPEVVRERKSKAVFAVSKSAEGLAEIEALRKEAVTRAEERARQVESRFRQHRKEKRL